MTGFSNSLMIIEEAVGAKSAKCASLPELKKSREELRTGILDPLAASGLLDALQIRQIHGEIAKTKLTTVKFQLEVIRNL
jgi:hypothetical protein